MKDEALLRLPWRNCKPSLVVVGSSLAKPSSLCADQMLSKKRMKKQRRQNGGSDSTHKSRSPLLATSYQRGVRSIREAASGSAGAARTWPEQLLPRRPPRRDWRRCRLSPLGRCRERAYQGSRTCTRVEHERRSRRGEAGEAGEGRGEGKEEFRYKGNKLSISGSKWLGSGLLYTCSLPKRTVTPSSS